MKETMSDPTWASTIGKSRSTKHKETKADPIWKATTGIKQRRKMKEAKANPIWVAANTFVCPHCGRSIKPVVCSINGIIMIVN